MEYVQEDALSIEVWGHRSGGDDDFFAENYVSKEFLDNFKQNLKPETNNIARLKMEDVAARKVRNLQERWAEVTKRIEMWIEIKELDENGDYVNVDVLPALTQNKWITLNSPSSCATGGIYQLKQVCFFHQKVII